MKKEIQSEKGKDRYKGEERKIKAEKGGEGMTETETEIGGQ